MIGMDNDGLFFFIISTCGRGLAAACLLGSCLGLLQHGRAVMAVAVSQKAGAPQAVIPPCQGTVFELLPPKCQGTVLERTRRTAESNCLDCCTAASNSAWRFSRRLGGTVRKLSLIHI